MATLPKKEKNMKKLIIAVVALCVLIGGGIGIGIAVSNKNNTATAVATMNFDGGISATNSTATLTSARDEILSTGPSFQFVLNANNKILSVNCLNQSADIVLCDIDVNGNTINEASVKITNSLIEKGFAQISVTTESQNIFSLTISAQSQEQAEKIKAEVKQKIDSVFDENGIFGTVKSAIQQSATNAKEKYTQIANQIGIEAKELIGKTEAEILQIIKDYSKKIQDVAGEKLAELKTLASQKLAEFDTSKLEEQLAQLEAELSKLENSELASQFKDQIKAFKQQINELKSQLDEIVKNAKQAVDQIIEQLIETSKNMANEFKSQAEQFANEFKSQLDAHKQEFEQEKNAKLEQIRAWRESLAE